VVDFLGCYNAILGRPCYAKFIVVHNYTYQKLKIPWLRGVITVTALFKAVYACERYNSELVSTLVEY
jgi:hypothetical protein